jgi:hypothetical protein
MPLAPIVLFVYNRPRHTEQTLNALAANKLANASVLYIYADGPKQGATAETLQSIKTTRSIIRKQKWCREVFITESEVNKGLADSILQGVTEVVNKCGRVIVLEDDLVTHPFFLTYMNHYLGLYEHEQKVISVHGFMYPLKKKIEAPFFLKGADCWGWATWKRGWDLFNADGKQLLDEIQKKNLGREFNFNNSYNYLSLLKAQIERNDDSWAVRWYASAFVLEKLTLYPPVSLVRNIGFDGSGLHKDMDDSMISLSFDFESFETKTVEPKENKKIKRQVENFFRGKHYYFNKLKKKLYPLYKGRPRKFLTNISIITKKSV